ncbi:hypothetical protein [Cohnella sp. REN36]|uniref:hypothetical protein n=1 Tax=Cohnella sp. REN36 TaxID=2887347 RepID=UPI001D14E43D|nr:hypothetical protein [Cohnella sp. REN36]MCC3376082.1 hypothetical protein [Cohnella sp. REN36]
MPGWTRGRRAWIAAMLIAAVCAGLAPAEAAPAPESAPLATKTPPAAFVREGDLWIKADGHERAVTSGEYVRHPKWSRDGKWIAFTRGKQEEELWVMNVATGESRLISDHSGPADFRWSPTGSRLAYLSQAQLYLCDMQPEARPLLVAADISNFAWLPDGAGFLASSAAHLLAGTWTPVRIGKIRLPSGGKPGSIETFYVLPAMGSDFFAVGTSTFKWSADGRWIAFVAKPTASLSVDADYLCVLSADGRTFKTIGRMLAYEEWFSWAPQGANLAYIGGIGRETTQDKKLTVASVPNGKPAVYTPTGYVDQSLAWRGERRIAVSRAPESTWSANPAARPLPYLAEANLDSGSQAKLTSPGADQGDYGPISLPGQRLAWVRSDRATGQADVLISGANPAQAAVWIRHLDQGTDYYEHLDWSPVLGILGQPAP